MVRLVFELVVSLCFFQFKKKNTVSAIYTYQISLEKEAFYIAEKNI